MSTENNNTDGHAIIKAVDPYLPSGIRESGALSLESLIRARVLTSILILSMGATLLPLLICVFLHTMTPHDFTLPVYIAGGSFAVVLLDYLYFKKTARLDSAGVLYSLSFFIICIVAIVFTGGYHSPVTQILIVCPIMSFLINGKQEGFYNAALVFVAGIVLLALDEINFNLIQIMPKEILSYLSGIIWFTTIGLTLSCLHIYDFLLEEKRQARAKK